MAFISNQSYFGTSAGGSAGPSAGTMAGLAGFQAVINAWTSYTQGSAAKRVAEANARIAEVNRDITEIQAKDALRRGQLRESGARGKTKRLIGRQRASLAAQGIRTDTGSAQDVQTEAADFGELDAISIRNTAAREAFGYRSEGAGFGTRAFGSRLRGEQARSQGIFDASQSLLTGGMRALDIYREWK